MGHAGTATHVPGVQGGLTGVRLRAQGHPFNAALRENRAMVRTLQYGGIGFALLVLDLVPSASCAAMRSASRWQNNAGPIDCHPLAAGKFCRVQIPPIFGGIKEVLIEPQARRAW